MAFNKRDFRKDKDKPVKLPPALVFDKKTRGA